MTKTHSTRFLLALAIICLAPMFALAPARAEADTYPYASKPVSYEPLLKARHIQALAWTRAQWGKGNWRCDAFGLGLLLAFESDYRRWWLAPAQARLRSAKVAARGDYKYCNWIRGATFETYFPSDSTIGTLATQTYLLDQRDEWLRDATSIAKLAIQGQCVVITLLTGRTFTEVAQRIAVLVAKKVFRHIAGTARADAC